MDSSPSEFILQDNEKSFEAAQKEKRRIKINIHNKLLQAFEDVGSSVQSGNKSLKDLEDEYHKIYLNKINLAEKLEFTSQLYRLLFGINDTQRLHQSDEPKPFIGKYEEEAWIKDMQNLDMEFLNTPYTIQKMSNVWSDEILTKWYWQLKAYLRDLPVKKNLTTSELLLVDVIAYDITYTRYNCNEPVLKFSTRRSGHVVQVCVPSVGQNGPHFIRFDFPLAKSINEFHKIFRMDKQNESIEKVSPSPSPDFLNFIEHIVWNEMDELFEQSD